MSIKLQGRPILYPDRVEISRKTYARLRVLARQRGMTVSRLANALLLQHVRNKTFPGKAA